MLASAILANLRIKDPDSINFIKERIQIKKIIDLIKEAESEQGIDEEKIVFNLEFWINSLNNDELRRKVSEDNIGIEFYEVITNTLSNNQKKLSLNIERMIVELIIMLTIGFKDNEDILSKRIIEDLDLLQHKKDNDYVNNILTPLLKAEKKVPVSFDFINKNTYYTFASAIEQ